MPDAHLPAAAHALDYWLRFASTGDPNGQGGPSWPAYRTASDEHLVLDDPPHSASGLAKSDCDFWDEFCKTPLSTAMAGLSSCAGSL